MLGPVPNMKIIIPFFILLFSHLLIAGGDTLGNGGGFIENEIEYVWTLFSPVVSKCLREPLCASQSENIFLNSVLNRKTKHNLSLEFYEETNRPTLKGKASALSPTALEFNTTFLYSTFKDPILFSLADALNEIIKGLADKTELAQINPEQLASKLSQFYFFNEKTISLLPFGISDVAFKFFGKNQNAMFITDPEGLKAVNGFILNSLGCNDHSNIESHQRVTIEGYSSTHHELMVTAKVLFTCQNIRYTTDILLNFYLEENFRGQGAHIINLNKSLVREKGRQRL